MLRYQAGRALAASLLLFAASRPLAQSAFPAIETLPSISHLPDPFLMKDGARLGTKEQWRTQRAYLLDMVQYYEYGRMPPPPGNVKGTVVSTTVSADPCQR